MTTTMPPGFRARLALWLALLVGWIVLVPLLWDAFTTVPNPERLAQPRMVRIPTLGAVAGLVARSALEVAALLVLLLPWRPGRYLARLWAAAVGVWVWFLATTPLGLTRMVWVHRRWLAAVGAGLLVASVLATSWRVLARRGDPPERPNGSPSDGR